MYSAEPPNLLIYNNANKVDEPYERSTEEQYDRNNYSDCVLSIKTFEQTIYCPNNVEYRNAKYELNNKRKIVNSFDCVFHLNSPL